MCLPLRSFSEALRKASRPLREEAQTSLFCFRPIFTPRIPRVPWVSSTQRTLLWETVCCYERDGGRYEQERSRSPSSLAGRCSGARARIDLAGSLQRLRNYRLRGPGADALQLLGLPPQPSAELRLEGRVSEEAKADPTDKTLVYLVTNHDPSILFILP